MGLQAVAWFWRQMESMRRMETASRADLEKAAQSYFEQLLSDHRTLPAMLLGNLAAREDRRRELRSDLLMLQKFLAGEAIIPAVDSAAREMLFNHRLEPDQLSSTEKHAAAVLAARALAEEARVLLRQLGAPEPTSDPLFEAPNAARAVSGLAPAPGPVSATKTLGAAIKEHLAAKQAKGVSPNTIAESGRVLEWLAEDVGGDTELSLVDKPRMRKFRDDLRRLRAGLQGQAKSFQQRLTNEPAGQIKSATAIKYWNSVAGFFSWCAAELDLHPNPCEGIAIEKAKHEEKRTPEPFSDSEIGVFLATPLFQGRSSVNRPNAPGAVMVRDGKWWAIVLLMHTGMRPGEVTQLLPSDFVFDHAIPHLLVRTTDGEGKRVKSVKNAASVRSVPLHANLLRLGLRQFVEGRAKAAPPERVFRDFRLGAAGKYTEGMTQFTTLHLKACGLHKPGRASHVWRHTVVKRLRDAGCLEEEITALVGHAGKSMTSAYGGEYPLERKAKTVERLTYVPDLVTLLGGEFDYKVHRCA